VVDNAVGWEDIQPLPVVDDDVTALLGRVDDLRDLWEETLSTASPDQVRQVRERTLRRHAVETGILDHLHGLSRRVTELLITEGITRQTAEREGEPSEEVLGLLLDQYEALEQLTRAAPGQDTLALDDVCALCRSFAPRPQASEGPEPGPGDPRERSEQRSARETDVRWRTRAAHARRRDGTPIAFAPPGQVRPALERLLRVEGRGTGTHPIVHAAWFHHQFLRVRPLADGNGRTVRALTAAVLLRARYAPLVVDRRQREEYLDALDTAHRGDLHPLILLFARSQEIALRSELVRPERLTGSDALDIARVCVQRMRSLKDSADSARNARVRTLAGLLQVRLFDHLDRMRKELHDAFTPIDHSTRIWIHRAGPPEERASWWKAQLVSTARQCDFWANLGEGSWWTQLEVTVLAQTLNYVVAVQRSGHGQTGVLVVTAFAELRVPVYGRDGVPPGHPVPLIASDPRSCITLLHTDAPDTCWPEVHDLVDRTLSAAMARFGAGLS